MEAQNDTEQDVPYAQNGSGGGGGLEVEGDGATESLQIGILTPRGTPGSKKVFTPGGRPPWKVTFGCDGSMVVSDEFSDPHMTVTLNPGCSISMEAAIAARRRVPERNGTAESVTTI